MERYDLIGKLCEDLLKIQTPGELDELVGELTSEEQQLLESLDSSTHPSEEERQALGPDFVQRIVDRTVSSIRNRELLSPMLAEGFALLALLAELEVNRLTEGTLRPESKHRTTKVVDGLADLWTRRLEVETSYSLQRSEK
ncbi:MAG: hypothetical protein HYX92_00010 [Chloroflexi bacterium]|nr:hypothetical protein [Chloroflexota bacterium]